MSKPLISKAFIKKMESIRDRIGTERDALREMVSEINSLADTCDQGIEALEQAIDHFSKQA